MPTTIAHKRSRYTGQQRELAAAFDELYTEVQDVKHELQINTAKTAEVLEVLDALKGGFRVLGWLGAFAKWVAGLAAACAAIYTAWHHLWGGK